MNSDSSGSARIPLSLDIDTASLSQAQQAAERFEGTIEDLKRQLEGLRQQFTKIFNAQTAGLGGAMQVPDYGSFKSAPAGQAGLMQSIVGATPQLSQLQARIAQLERQEATGAVTGPPAAGGPPASTPPPESRATPGHAPERPRPFSERLSENVLRARPLTVAGAFAHGDYLAGGRTIARAFLETMATDVRYARTLSRGVLGTAATSAAMVTGGASGGGVESAMSAGAAGAAGAAEGSMVGRLGAVLMGPIGAIAAGLAVVAGAVVGVDTMRKQVAGQEYLLRGSVGGIGSGGDVGAFQGRLDAVGWRYMYKSADTLKAADALGAAGVTAGQMPGAVGNSMAFAKVSGQDLGRVTALTSQMMVQGGMSATQVGAAYSQLQAAADQSGQSVAKLITSLEDLLRTTGGGTQQINGLAAVQSILGPSVGAAQAVGQPMMATGAQAINIASMLGISTEHLQKIQDTGNTAQMYDLMASFAKRIAGGRKDQTTIDVVEANMQSVGMLDFAHINPRNATPIIRTMLNQGPRAAQDQAEKIQRATALQTEVGRERALQIAGEHVAGALATVGDHILIEGDKAAQDFALSGNNINAAIRRWAGGQDKRVYVSPSGPPTAVNGIPLPGRTPNVYSTMPLLGAPISSGTYNLPGGGTRIPNSRGGFDTMDPTMFRQVVAAATRYKVPVALLMAELAKESDLNPAAERHNGPGDTSYGVAQFTPQTLDTLRKRRGSPIFGMTQAQALAAAKNQGQAIPLAAYYNRYLYEQNGNDWQAGASAYNGSAAYGAAVMASSGQIMQTLHAVPASGPSTPAHSTAGGTQQVKVHLTGTLDVRDEHGWPMGTATIKPQTATIDPTRTPVGHRPVAPRPAIPHAPLHDHNRRA